MNEPRNKRMNFLRWKRQAMAAEEGYWPQIFMVLDYLRHIQNHYIPYEKDGGEYNILVGEKLYRLLQNEITKQYGDYEGFFKEMNIKKGYSFRFPKYDMYVEINSEEYVIKFRLWEVNDDPHQRPRSNRGT